MQDDEIIKENEVCNNYKFYKTKDKKIQRNSCKKWLEKFI